MDASSRAYNDNGIIMADVTSIIEYYVNLLIIQYNNKPKARAAIEAIVREVLADGVLLDVRDGFDIDTSVGAQLDILGQYIGVHRFYLGDPYVANYFGFADAVNPSAVSANIVGFNDADAPDKEGLFLDADEVIVNRLRLNDEAYRTLLKLKIVQNYSDHSTGSIVAGLFEFFADGIAVKDNYNMTMTYLVGDVSNALVRAALQKGVLPKPMGVGLQVVDGNAFFGFADATRTGSIPDYLRGFNDATVGLTKDGGFLNATNDII